MNRVAPAVSALTALLFFSPFAVSTQERGAVGAVPGPFGGELPVIRDELDDAMRARLHRSTAANIAQLRAQGRLADTKASAFVRFGWPVKLTDGHPDRHGYIVGNYVDEDPSFPNAVLDWSCGTRSYDLPTGNHRGTDFASWPFPWRRMAQGETIVAAAASGIIVDREDGNPDQSCTIDSEPRPTNFVLVRHDDGSVAWYVHLKSGSLTTKQIGDAVAAGEFLGIVGSSGNSTVPHLHFEVYDSDSQLVDPWAGACNRRGTPSRWLEQEPYYVSRVHRLATADAAPEFPPCPGIERPHEQQYFARGQTLYAVAYFRDLRRGDVPVWTIYRPDGSKFTSIALDTTSVLTRDVFEQAYFFYSPTLPLDAPRGEWTFAVEYLEEIHRTSFYVGVPEPPRLAAVEYYAPSLDHYFVTAFAEEQVALDLGVPVAGWARTGASFPVYGAAGPLELLPACRFFGTPGLGVNSHFYTVIPAECSAVKLKPDWTFEANAFYARAPLAGGCPDGTRPLYRLYNDGMRGSPNHRYVTDLAAAARMTASGWLLEGVAMCIPP